MKTFKNIKLLILFVFIVSISSLLAQDFTSSTKSLAIGDINSFSSHFDSNIELTVLEEEAIYSTTQINAILTRFFSKNKPSAYKTVHKGSSGNGAFFEIGELTTSTKVFRIYLYAKKINGKFLIQEFRIE